MSPLPLLFASSAEMDENRQKVMTYFYVRVAVAVAVAVSVAAAAAAAARPHSYFCSFSKHELYHRHGLYSFRRLYIAAWSTRHLLLLLIHFCPDYLAEESASRDHKSHSPDVDRRFLATHLMAILFP